METINKIEKLSKNKEKLLSLEKENKYLFHGSPDTIDTLEPRQPFNNKEEYGSPSVCATPFVNIAIFRSLIHKNNLSLKENSQSSFGIKNNEISFSTTKNLFETAKLSKGKVYILDKNKFKKFNDMEYRSEESIKPLEFIEVDFNDLPKGIKIN